MKRTLFISIAALMIPTAAFADTSMLIKSPDSSAVYLVQDGSRHPFPIQSIYESWYGTTFTDVKIVTPETLASYPLGKNVKFKQGSLIKIQTDPKVYLVKDDAGTLEWIQTEADFKSRGYQFKDVRDVPDPFFPDYVVPSPEQHFATPEQGTTPTSTPPVVIAPTPAIQSINSTAVRNETRSTISYTITSNTPAALTLSYQVLGQATSTKTFNTGTSFTGTIDAGLAEIVPYHIELGTGDTKIVKEGTFEGYADFHIGRLDTFAPTAGSLIQPSVRLGAFQVTNGSTSQRLISKYTLIFNSGSSASNDITKSLEIRALNADGSIKKSLGEKIVGANTSILGTNNPQSFPVEELFAPGETHMYEVVGKYFDTMNKDRYAATDTFTTQFDRAESSGDVITIYSNKELGKVYYK